MELFKILGKIAVDNTEANKSLDDTADRAEMTGSKFSGVFQKVGSVAAGVGKVCAAGIAAAATGIAAVAKNSLEAYGDYEQLVGGVETLFGAGGQSLEEYAKSVGKTTREAKEQYNNLIVAQEAVIEKAAGAYKTAGMTANEYMETVTGFSAALISSMGGDTVAAAEKADMAITDMSDNANKMGSDLASIQNAYSGFAKQNYTMLDNLKLGYGGTKEEMQRLLDDATKLSGVKYDISQYGDIVDAIHVVQTEMGITGTTAKEAASTIQGSIGMMKAAWGNLVTGFGDEDADLSGLVDQFVDSALTAADNVIPRIEIILNGIAAAIPAVIPKITQKLPELINSMLPPLIKGAVALVNGLVAALPTILQVLIEQIPFIVSQLVSGLMGMLPGLLSAAKEIGGKVLETLAGAVGSGDDGIFEGVGSRLGRFAENLKLDAIDAFSGKLEALKDLLGAVMGALQPVITIIVTTLSAALEDIVYVLDVLVLPVVSGILDAVISVGTTILTAIQPALENISSVWTEFTSLVQDLFTDGIVETLSSFIDMIGELWAENQDKVSKIGELFAVVFDRISSVFQWFYDNIVCGIFIPAINCILTIVQDNMDNIQAVFQSVFDVIGGIVDFFIALFKGDWEGMWNAVKNILYSASQYIRNLFNLIFGIISSIIGQIKERVVSKFNEIKDDVHTKLTEAKDSVKNIFTTIEKTIKEKIDNAKKTVKEGIDKIKEFFNFDWKFPDLKVPKIKASGEFSLNPLKVPSFDIEWCKNGAILTAPTPFAINPKTGNVMAGGEAGPEAVAPIDLLMEYVSAAVAEQNRGLQDLICRLVELIETYMPELLVAAKKQVVLNNGVLVGELAPAIDREIGGISNWKERGNK